jgi:uncharacterized protein (TIGR00369 family)
MPDDTSSVIHPRVRTVLESDRGILETFGIVVHKAQHGVCELSGTVADNMVNASGFAHGSIAYALMDTACAYALGSIERRGVTVHGNVSYIKGAVAGSTFDTRVEVVSHGRRVATLRGEVYLLDSGQPELAAHGSFVFQLREETTTD